MSLRTPLYDEHLALGGRMVDFGGWELPQQYTTIRDEHVAVRTGAGLFDLSHMGRVHLDGDGATDYLQDLLTNDVGRLAPGRAQYTLMCDESGGIIDDLVVYRRGPESFLIVINASNRLKDLEWMRGRLPAGLELTDRTTDIALLALQGPQAEALMPVASSLAQIPYFGFEEAVSVAGIPVTVSRTGYTGEDGFEIFVDAARAPQLWRALLAPGAPVASGGLLPAGLGARDACRMEAGLRLYGNDMDQDTNPFDAGLGWVVKLADRNFCGSAALRELKSSSTRTMVGLRATDRAIPRHGATVAAEGREVGTVTSGTYSFWLGHGIAMASVERDSIAPGTTATFAARGASGPADVVALPIYRGSVRMPAPAGS